MEPAPEADDLVFVGVRLGETEGGFDRLGAAAVELGASEAAGRELGDQAQKTQSVLGGEAADRDAPSWLSIAAT